LKTDSQEQREFKRLHPDHPPMEELRPWLRKCVVDVTKLKDPKYIDNHDDAIIKMEPAVRHEESSSDQDGTDDDQNGAPATPPPDSEPEDMPGRLAPEAMPQLDLDEMRGLEAMPPLDPMFYDNDLYKFAWGLDNHQPLNEFDLSTESQPSAIPRTTNNPQMPGYHFGTGNPLMLDNIFDLHLQGLGVQKTQVNELPDFNFNQPANQTFDSQAFDSSNDANYNGNGNTAVAGDSFMEDDFLQQYMNPILHYE